MDTFVSSVAAKSGFDPATIFQIITSIIAMIQNCAKPAPAPAPPPKPVTAADITDGSARAHIALFSAMRQNDVRPRSAEGRKLHATILEEAKAASESDKAEFLALCQEA